MSTDILGICVTIGVSVLVAGVAIGLGVFFGLRNFTSTFSDRVSKAKDAIVGELSPIRDRLVTIDERTNSMWQRELGKISSTGTVEKYLKNFAKTKITASPGKDETSYIIEVEKGTLEPNFILKVSEETRLNSIEKEMFGKLVGQVPLRANRIKLTVPSTDPKLCTKYISIFLNWLDTEYVKALNRISDFESGIEV